jgi:hypothetical protein
LLLREFLYDEVTINVLPTTNICRSFVTFMPGRDSSLVFTLPFEFEQFLGAFSSFSEYST